MIPWCHFLRIRLTSALRSADCSTMRRPTAAVLAALITLAVPLEAATAANAAGTARFRSADVIDGPDVASYQHPYGAKINWRAVARTHKDFAIVKATEGTSYRNPWFWRDYSGARKAGLARGSYHFARPGYPLERTAFRQARYYVDHIGDVTTNNTLPPALDLESTGGLGRGALVTWAQLFLLKVRHLTGRTPMIYTYPSFWTGALGDPTALARYPLWMASYSGPADDSATLWQYTSGARVDGIRGRVDMSVLTEPVDVWDTMRDGRISSPWPAQEPGAPVRVDAHGSDSTANVTWLPGDTGSSAVDHYTVSATPTDGTAGASSNVPGTTTQATVSGLTNGTEYTITVTATNTQGGGEPSTEVSVVPRIPTELTLGGPTETTYGDNARVAIRLVRPDRNHGLPGRELVVEQRVQDGTDAGWQPLSVATTDDHGWLVLHMSKPRHNVDLRVTFTGPTEAWRDARRTVRVLVRNGVTSGLSKHRVRHGHYVTMRGHVKPALEGVRVIRQAFYGHRWHNAGSTYTDANGDYKLRFAPATKGVHYYRTYVAGFDGRAHGSSPSRRLRVH
jgi:GH25 family lysozyme M1 (1,4-beta-N-acetylmuramidase)